MSFDHMVDMQKAPEGEADSPAVAEEPMYPYGLSLTLDDETMEKLGLDHNDEDCQVGNFLHLHALAEVVGIHKSDSAGGPRCSINLQIKFMKAESEEDENDEADDEMDEGQTIRAAGYY